MPGSGEGQNTAKAGPLYWERRRTSNQASRFPGSCRRRAESSGSGSPAADELGVELARLPPCLRQLLRNFSGSKTWSCFQMW